MPDTVLIVDDDPVQRRLLEAMVRRFGYAALTADGGDIALRLLEGLASIRWCGSHGTKLENIELGSF